MPHDDSQDHRSSFTVNRRQVLGILGGASVLTLLGANPALASQGDREKQGDLGRDEEISLDTRLVRDYGLRYPIVSAGMAFVGLPELVVAVSNAGGLGVYGAAPEPPPVVDARLSAIASQTSQPFGVDFILASGPMAPFTTQDHIDIAAAHRVPVVVVPFRPAPEGLGRSVAGGRSRVWVQAGSVEVAEEEAASLGCDAVIAQGKSAGGHNHNQTARSLTLALLARVRSRLPRRWSAPAAGVYPPMARTSCGALAPGPMAAGSAPVSRRRPNRMPTPATRPAW